MAGPAAVVAGAASTMRLRKDGPAGSGVVRRGASRRCVEPGAGGRARRGSFSGGGDVGGGLSGGGLGAACPVGGRQGGRDQRRGNAGFSPGGRVLARVRG